MRVTENVRWQEQEGAGPIVIGLGVNVLPAFFSLKGGRFTAHKIKEPSESQQRLDVR